MLRDRLLRAWVRERRCRERATAVHAVYLRAFLESIDRARRDALLFRADVVQDDLVVGKIIALARWSVRRCEALLDAVDDALRVALAAARCGWLFRRALERMRRFADARACLSSGCHLILL